MATMDRFLLWMYSIFVYSVRTATPLDKNLMLLQSRSASQFDSTWLMNTLNDVNNNKAAETNINALLIDGEFKASIDPAWGEPELVFISYLNANGDTIGQIQFYVPGTNISMQTTWMTSSFDLISPYNKAWNDASVTVRDVDKEMVVRDAQTSDTYLAIVHPASGSEFVLAVNTTQPLVSGSVTAGSLGCKPTSILDNLYKDRSANNMTVETCGTLCEAEDYLFVGIKFGIDCYCVNITIGDLYGDVPAYCPYTCSGNVNQLCGGSSDAFMSVYNVTGQTDQLDTLTAVPTSTLLSVASNTGYTDELVIDVSTEVSWSQDYMYITGIKVVGQNSTGDNVKYSFQHKYNPDDSLSPYTTGLNGTTWIGLTGIQYELEPLLIGDLTVLFLDNTTSITVSLIGPIGSDSSPAYVTAEYVLVRGTFTPTTTTTTSLANTTTIPNSTTSAPNSTISVTNSTASSTNSTTTTAAASNTTPSTTATTTSAANTTSSSNSTTSALNSTTSVTNSTTSSTNSTTTTAAASNTPSSTTTPSAVASTNTTTTLSTTTSAYSNLSIVINGQVYCPCAVANTTNVTTDIATIIAELTLDTSTLSATTRKYNSAEDNRPSAKTIGALGVIIISFVIGCIVVMDSANLKSEAVKIKRNYRYLKKQLSKRSLKVDDISTVNKADPNVENLPDVLM